MKRLFALFVACLLSTACGSDNDTSQQNDGGSEGRDLTIDGLRDIGALKPCPLGGLKTVEEITDWRSYDCKKPQFCPDQGQFPMPAGGYVVDADALPWSANVMLNNCSATATLEIVSLVVYGDDRCSFSEAMIEKTTIGPNEIAVLKVDWKPESAGEDHAAISIRSNAENFPELILPICGRAIDAPGEGAPLEGCRDVRTVNTACHARE